MIVAEFHSRTLQQDVQMYNSFYVYAKTILNIIIANVAFLNVAQ